MDMELLPIVMLVSGAVLLYGAVKNKNPIGVVQAALTGKPIDEVAPLDSGGSGSGLPPGVVPNDQLPPSTSPGDGRPGDPKAGNPDGSTDPLPDWLKTNPLTGQTPSHGVDPRDGAGTPSPSPGGLSSAPVSYRPVSPIITNRWV